MVNTYPYTYKAKIMKLTEDLAVLEIDLGFRVWKVVPIVLDKHSEKEYRTGDIVRVFVRMERSNNHVGALHTYYGYIRSV